MKLTGMNELFYTKRVLEFADQNLKTKSAQVRESFSAHTSTTLWGLWQGVFGLAANQLIAVSAHAELDDNWRPPEGCEVVTQWVVKPTARPQTPAPLTRAGVYVFRDFWLPYEHLEEAVMLSSEAWQTFETAEAFATEPMGLFAPAQELPASQECQLHLLTWYPDFTSWEISRQSDPSAMQRFISRRELTRTTHAVATRLLLPS